MSSFLQKFDVFFQETHKVHNNLSWKEKCAAIYCKFPRLGHHHVRVKQLTYRILHWQRLQGDCAGWPNALRETDSRAPKVVDIFVAYEKDVIYATRR
jgi:hypothetical protein